MLKYAFAFIYLYQMYYISTLKIKVIVPSFYFEK